MTKFDPSLRLAGSPERLGKVRFGPLGVSSIMPETKEWKRAFGLYSWRFKLMIEK